MSDPLSTVAAALAITITVFGLAKDTYHLVSGIRGAPDDIARLATDIKALYDVLGTLKTALVLEEAKGDRSTLPPDATSTIKEILENCEGAFTEIETLLKPYIDRDGLRRRRFWRSLKWEALTLA